MPALKWTESTLRQKMGACSSKVEFKKLFGNGAYKAANALGLLEEIFGKDKRKFLSDAEIINIGKTFDTKVAFKKGAYPVYQVACKRKLMDKIGHGNQKETWTTAKLHKAAAPYSTYSDFAEGNWAAYQAASIYGVLHELGLSSRTGKYAGLADVIYVWRAVGKTFNGIPVYKIGLTSSTRGDERIKRVARECGFEFDILFFENVGQGNAYRVERLLHAIGTDPAYVGFDGCSEFRALTSAQLEVVLEVLVNNATTPLPK